MELSLSYKIRLHLSLMYFTWNMSVTVHNNLTVWLPLAKPLPSSHHTPEEPTLGTSVYRGTCQNGAAARQRWRCWLEDDGSKFFQTVVTRLCNTSRDTEYSLQSSALELQISHEYPINCLLQFVQTKASAFRPEFKSRKPGLSHTKTKVKPNTDPYGSESWTASRPVSHFGFPKGRDTRFQLRMSVFIVLISYWTFKLEVRFPFWVFPLPPWHFGLQIWKKAGNK